MGIFDTVRLVVGGETSAPDVPNARAEGTSGTSSVDSVDDLGPPSNLCCRTDLGGAAVPEASSEMAVA
jgi:hypothetical protein